MLTNEQKKLNKSRFLDLIRKVDIDIEKFAGYLDSVDYFERPYTTKYIEAYRGGLCIHALKVYAELKTLTNAYFPGKYSEEDIIKAALLKDIYKAELYEPYLRNVKNEATGKWEQVEEFRYKETRPVFGELGFSSYMIAKNFTTLSDEVIEAITNWSCGAESQFKTRDIYEVLNQYKLAVLLHLADYAATYLN